MGRDTIVFNGIAYTRYPGARRYSDRTYYRAAPADRRRGFTRLHVDLWRSVYGEVPAGCHIHHRDNNPLNNAIDNLVCLTPGEHVDAHRGNPLRHSPEWLAKLDAARLLSSQWQRSLEGRETARRRALRQWAGKHKTERTCEQCGGKFLSRYTGKSRFCGPRCDAAWRERHKAYHECRACAFCGSPFSVNKWSKTATCSRSCAQRHRRARPGAGVQPHG